MRIFLRHDRALFAEIGKLIFALISEYYSEAVGRAITTGMVSSHQTFGEFATWHPHWHMIVLEGGFDQCDRFYFISVGANEKLQELWRRRVVAFFVDKGLVKADLATSMLGWYHSDFSIESGTRMYDDSARQSLSQCIIRAPVGLEKLTRDRNEDTPSWKAPENGHFKVEVRHFDSLDFIAQTTVHIPPKGKHLVRRYGVYSSRGRSTWKSRPALKTRAPPYWYGCDPVPIDEPIMDDDPVEVGAADEVAGISPTRTTGRMR